MTASVKAVPASADALAAALARRQHGAWSRRQALDVGFSPTMIHTRVRRGDWIAQDRGVYAHATSTPSWHRSVMVAVLAEPWAVASHRCAAVLHEVPGFRPGRPEVTVRPGANARGRLAVVHRGIDVTATTVRGIPTVSLAQCFVDLSQTSGEDRVQEALSSTALWRPTLLPELRDRYCVLAPRGGRDLRPLRRILEGFDGDELLSDSELEQLLHGVVRCPEIPPVTWQAPFPGRQPGSHRVDGLIEAWDLILEADGRSWHARVRDFDRDRRRDAEAAAAGYQTLRLSACQLRHEPAWARDVIVRIGAQRTRR